MTVLRTRLANRRATETFGFRCNNLDYSATISYFPGTNQLAEIFISNSKAGSHSDSAAKDSAVVASISLLEKERGSQIGAGWDPQHHQPTDVYTTYYDKDFLLGLNAAETTLAAIAQLTGARLKK